MPEWVIDTPKTRLTQFSKAELGEQFLAFAQKLGIKTVVTTQADFTKDLEQLCEFYKGGPIIINNDQRLLDLGVASTLTAKYGDLNIWNQELGDANIELAAQANIGIVYGEYGLTESAGIVLEQTANYGRSVSLLPTNSIVVLKASTILPSMAQYAALATERTRRGERQPSVINLISGPSSTADIELVRVVGVHGPVALAYIIVNDDDSLVIQPA